MDINTGLVIKYVLSVVLALFAYRFFKKLIPFLKNWTSDANDWSDDGKKTFSIYNRQKKKISC